MSQVKISGNASGTGTLTIAAPNTNTDRTLSLPDNTGTILDTSNTTFFGADWYVMTANNSSNGTKLTNWQNSLANSGKIGTGMSESSGTWTFPTTGIWWIYLGFRAEGAATDNAFTAVELYTTPDNSTYTKAARAGIKVEDEGVQSQQFMCFMFDVQDTSNYKCYYQSVLTGSNSILGSTTSPHTTVGFIRLGDT